MEWTSWGNLIYFEAESVVNLSRVEIENLLNSRTGEVSAFFLLFAHLDAPFVEEKEVGSHVSICNKNAQRRKCKWTFI